MEKEFNPFVSLAMSMMFGAGEGGEVPDGKAETIPVSNAKWHEKYSTDIYLEDLEDSAWDASYFAILDAIHVDSEATYKDVMVPYSADDYAVFYAEENGNYYFWLPLDGMRLKVYEDNGIAKFESLKVDEFSLYEDVSSLSNEVNNIQNQADGIEFDVDALNERVFHGKVVYGFHIDSTESDPYQCVTYLEDAVNMIPAHMDFANDRFDYGTWENAFFMPRPCMLKYDGTVDYYLDPNDYSKREDGTPSDVSNVNYAGNAMIEWGQNGKKIWYKIVPDADPTSASVYIASYRVDDGYNAWSFVNNQGIMVNHFYTPIYNGTLDTSGRLRSISGKTYTDFCKSKTAAKEIEAAELNNPSTDKLWYTEVFADVTLINLLLILVGKSLATQETFGYGIISRTSAETNMEATGTLDSKGLFYGANTTGNNAKSVKVFGMENWWGNQWRRYAGHVTSNYVNYYKMTRGTQDGSTASDYSTTGTGYLIGATSPSLAGTGNYCKKCTYNADGFFCTEASGATQSTYYCDYFNISTGTRYALRGGACSHGRSAGAFSVDCYNTAGNASWGIGASPSCKPLL